MNADQRIPTVHNISTYLDELLQIRLYSDTAHNGLQIESQQAEVSKIAFAVDAGLSLMQRAVEAGCQLLITHHGVFWGKVEPLTGSLGSKVALCMTRGLSLYSSHLPLDGHQTLGNAAQIGNHLQLSELHPFGNYNGMPCGISGSLPQVTPIKEIAALIQKVTALHDGSRKVPLILNSGKSEIRTVAIASGSASALIGECAEKDIDLFVSGEPKHEVYQRAKDLHCSAIFAGHYATETFGVIALERVLAERFRVETVWLDEPSGI